MSTKRKMATTALTAQKQSPLALGPKDVSAIANNDQ